MSEDDLIIATLRDVALGRMTPEHAHKGLVNLRRIHDIECAARVREARLETLDRIEKAGIDGLHDGLGWVMCEIAAVRAECALPSNGEGHE